MTLGIILAIGAITFTAIGQVMLKAGTAQRTTLMLGGYGCFAAATLLSLIALRSVPLSLYMCWSASTYILVGVLSHIFLNERLVNRQWFGLCTIIAGITLFSFA